MTRRVLAAATLCIVCGSADAATIVSTTTGGPWDDGATWVGGVVPGADDDVVLAGPVQVTATRACAGLDVLSTGLLTTSTAGVARLDVSGSVSNEGTIEDTFPLTLSIGGDLAQHGVLANDETVFTGVIDHHVAASTDVECDLTLDDAATGDVRVDTPLRTLADVDLGSGRMVLGTDCPLTLGQSGLSGTLVADGNEVRFESWSYLLACTIEDAVLVGTATVTHGVTFTGTVTVMDLLQNSPSAGGSIVTIDGDLINRGDILRTDYSFVMFLSGDLETDGLIAISQIEMDDAAEHRVRMGPDGQVDANVFLPEFGAGTLITETDVHFSDGVSLGLGGTLVLAPSTTLRLTGSGSISGGALLANGSTIRMDGPGVLFATSMDHVVLDGSVSIVGTTTVTGGLTVTGSLRPRPGNPADLAIDGTFLNEGDVHDDGAALTITASGDLLNRGIMSNARVTLAGDVDQRVETGIGIGVPEFVLDSRLDATTYQWFRNGLPLAGETLSTLTFATVGVAEHGTYHCEGDGGVLSRLFVIAEGISVDVPSVHGPALEVLGPARPNPFRPVTTITFELARSGPVRLAVYDVMGREISVLVEDRLGAGPHRATWRPGDAAPGVYFFRLAAAGVERTRRGVLIE